MRSLLFTGTAFCLALLMGLSSGCTTTGETVQTTYNAERDQSVYETRPIRIERGGSGLGTSGRQIIYVKAQATCEGEGCTPESVRMLLSSGTHNVQWLDYDDVSIQADNWEYRWRNVSKREDPEFVGIGEFMRLSLPIDDFRAMLQTRSLTIQVGGLDVGLSFSQLERFRKMMVAMSPDFEQGDELLTPPEQSEDDVV